MEPLPIFPLQTVLFPGVVLPLNIFEERYRLLIRRLLAIPEDQPRRFGVVALRSGRETAAGTATSLHPVGCVAEVRRVSDRSDGGYEIITVGADRFRLRALHPDDEPYLTAEVDLLPDGKQTGPEVSELAARAGRRFTDYLDAIASIGGVQLSSFELPSDPDLLSYLIASAALLALPDRQSLLEQPSTSDRLRAELRLLARELVLVRELHLIPAPVSLD